MNKIFFYCLFYFRIVRQLRFCADQADSQPCQGRQVHHLRLRLSPANGHQQSRPPGEQREISEDLINEKVSLQIVKHVAGHLCGSTAFKVGFVAGKENLSACRMADKAFVCACLEVLVAHVGCDCRSTVYQPSSGFKIIDGKKSRTRQRGGVRLYAVYVLRCVFPHVSNFCDNPADEDFLQ